MKNLFVYTIIGLILLGCKTETKRTDYIINGSAEGVYNGVRAYLKVKNRNNREQIIDTAIVIDEKFTFTGSTQQPKLSFISVNSVNGNLPFILDNNIINVAINKSNISKSDVSGSKNQEDYNTFHKKMTNLRSETIRYKALLRNNRIYKEASKRDSLTKLFKAAEKKELAYPLEFINNNTDSFYSLILIEQEASKRNADIEAYIAAYNNLDSELKKTPKGVSTKMNLDNLLADYLKKSRLNIGKVAPNFEAPNPDGKMVSLNDIKGKVTIIDFWAAWCGPCRKENPNVVRIYNKYHDQGLEIISVSLDGSRSQRNPKQSWIDAIEKDQLSWWTHVSNLKYFQDPIAQLYNITSIPSVYILDAEGKIAAKNLRDKALELKVKELLNQ